jgi:hypothetical protein
MTEQKEERKSIEDIVSAAEKEINESYVKAMEAWKGLDDDMKKAITSGSENGMEKWGEFEMKLLLSDIIARFLESIDNDNPINLDIFRLDRAMLTALTRFHPSSNKSELLPALKDIYQFAAVKLASKLRGKKNSESHEDVAETRGKIQGVTTDNQ